MIFIIFPVPIQIRIIPSNQKAIKKSPQLFQFNFIPNFIYIFINSAYFRRKIHVADVNHKKHYDACNTQSKIFHDSYFSREQGWQNRRRKCLEQIENVGLHATPRGRLIFSPISIQTNNSATRVWIGHLKSKIGI